MNLEQQISRINNVRKQLELLEAELNELREQCKPHGVNQDFIDSYRNGQAWQYKEPSSVCWRNCLGNDNYWFEPSWITENQYRIHPHNDLIQAHKNGATIHAYIRGNWVQQANPDWFEDTQYRIAQEFEYPIYMQHKRLKGVTKFTGLKTGTCVVLGVGAWAGKLGVCEEGWIPHTDTDHWQPIAFDEERGIADKQLCECWADRHTHSRVIRFYDAVNKSVFSVEGKRNGTVYDKYLPIPYAEHPDWAIEAEQTLGE